MLYSTVNISLGIYDNDAHCKYMGFCPLQKEIYSHTLILLHIKSF